MIETTLAAHIKCQTTYPTLTLSHSHTPTLTPSHSSHSHRSYSSHSHAAYLRFRR
jgi:hypothetical protein